MKMINQAAAEGPCSGADDSGSFPLSCLEASLSWATARWPWQRMLARRYARLLHAARACLATGAPAHKRKGVRSQQVEATADGTLAKKAKCVHPGWQSKTFEDSMG